jgi:hypothetical protein
MPEFGLDVDPDLEAELRDYYQQITHVNRAAEELVRNLTDVQLQWAPEPNTWSIAKSLGHLLAADRAELPYIRRAIAAGRARKLFGHGPFQHGLLGRLLIRMLCPRSKLKLKAPKIYLPDGDLAPSEVVREFFVAQQGILDCIVEANGLHLSRIKVPVLGHKFVKLSLGDEFRVLAVHEQRHVAQAQRIKNHPGFP